MSQPARIWQCNTPSSQSWCGLWWLSLALLADVLLSLQMCSPLVTAVTLAFHSSSSFKRTSYSELAFVPLRPIDTPLYRTRLNLCGMWFRSADLHSAAKARHTLAWWESRIPFSAKDTQANIKQTGNQKADGLFLSKLLRPLIPTYPFSTHCFTSLIETQVIEISGGKVMSMHQDQDAHSCHTWSRLSRNSELGS